VKRVDRENEEEAILEREGREIQRRPHKSLFVAAFVWTPKDLSNKDSPPLT
jgi:hypothetical protein